MKTLLEAVNYRSMTKDIPSPMRGIEAILGGLSASSEGEVPIQPKKSEWTVVAFPDFGSDISEKLVRMFSFKNSKMVKDFVTHLIFEQEEMGHHARVIIENLDVTVETYTHDVNTVTELDQELADFCDNLYRDVQDFYLASDEESEEGDIVVYDNDE